MRPNERQCFLSSVHITDRLVSSIEPLSPDYPEIPNFTILNRIGGGSYGEVYLARTVTGLHRAVKVVSRDNFELEKTFEREFEGIQRYERVSQGHSGLVDVLHVGREEAADFYYYVMELADHVTGESIEEIDPEDYRPRTLDSVMRVSREMDIDTCIDLGGALAEALGHLHRAGLTHRDVKPSNVIFVNGRPQLADIGLVAATGQRTFVGTEGYVPPEGPGTSSADLYALAMVLYEMHTGKDRLEFPELPTNHQLSPTVNRDEWRALNGVICRAGSPDPRKRFETGLSFAEALRNVRPTTDHRASRYSGGSSKNYALLGGIAVVVIAVIVSAFFIFRGLNSEDDKEPVSIVEPEPEIVEIVEPPKVEEKKETEKPTEKKEEKPIVAAPVPKATRLIKFDSKPSGATVWVNGKELGRTPLAFQKFETGKLEMVYKLDGYFEKTVSRQIEKGEPLLESVTLKQDLRPKNGESWTNLGKMTFSMRENDKKYIAPVTAYAFEAFLLSTNEAGVSFAPQGIAQVANMEQRWRFCDWMTKQDRVIGYLSEEEFYVPVTPEADSAPHLYCLLEKNIGTIILKSTPEGASVFDVENSNQFLGKTPLELRRRIGPYKLKVSYDGYEVTTQDGYLTEELFTKSITLTRDDSVIFGSQWKNGLGMPMVPVGNMMVASYETRVIDYAKYLNEGNPNPGVFAPAFSQSGNHPLVSVNRADAELFCEWLTRFEKSVKKIREWHQYRLPTDREWSQIVGLPIESGASPKMREIEYPDLFPWGKKWPPPKRAGNFADESAKVTLDKYIITDYNDGFPQTSPVGNFNSSKTGIYDLGGNVWEWVSDDYDADSGLGVVRGGGWESYQAGILASSYRYAVNPSIRDEKYGFRFILVDTRKAVAPVGGE